MLSKFEMFLRGKKGILLCFFFIIIYFFENLISKIKERVGKTNFIVYELVEF